MPITRVAIALCAGVISACHEPAPRVAPVPAQEVKTIESPPPVTQVEPEPEPVAEPAPVEVESGAVVVPWRRAGACDPSGMWQVELSPQGFFRRCGGMEKETFELALGFVREADRTVLAAKGRPVGKRGKIGGLLGEVKVSQLAGPYVGCEVRLLMTRGRGARATTVEVVLGVHGDELQGQGARWLGPGRCSSPFTVFGERSAAGEWAKMGEAGQPVTVMAPKRADAELAAAVAKIPAASLLGPAVTRVTTENWLGEVTEHDVRTPVRGSIVEYVAAVVGEPRDVSLHEVPCSDPRAGRCVAVLGDPCRPELIDPESDCEGMFLNIVVDVERGRIDRADSGGYPVRSHADVAGWEVIAP
jgi:hypothetical protein